MAPWSQGRLFGTAREGEAGSLMEWGDRWKGESEAVPPPSCCRLPSKDELRRLSLQRSHHPFPKTFGTILGYHGFRDAYSSTYVFTLFGDGTIINIKD